MDQFEIFSSITNFTSIRIIFFIASIYNLEVYQMDIKMTFLNNKFDEEIYIHQLKDYVIQRQKDKV